MHLVTVQPAVPALLLAEEPQVGQTAQREAQEWARDYLSSTSRALSGTHDVRVTCAALEGSPPATLAEYVRLNGIGLIVMTTHGRSRISRFWLGSVTDQLLRRVAVPVLLLRAGTGRDHAEFHSVLVALDGSPAGEAVLEPTIALTSLGHATQYVLVHVIEPPIPIVTRMALHPAHMPPHWVERQRHAAQGYLETLAGRLRADGVSVTERVMVARGIGAQIIDVARAVGSDLVAVGTHGPRGAERLLLGSVADKVVRGATQPVLVVPIQTDRTRDQRESAER
jgi:nucleotide-binding universal stress UspA family protein